MSGDALCVKRKKLNPAKPSHLLTEERVRGRGGFFLHASICKPVICHRRTVQKSSGKKNIDHLIAKKKHFKGVRSDPRPARKRGVPQKKLSNTFRALAQGTILFSEPFRGGNNVSGSTRTTKGDLGKTTKGIIIPERWEGAWLARYPT